MHGRIAGDSVEDGSGHIRGTAALAVLHRNGWFTSSNVAETRIKLGERARKPNEGSVG